MKSDAPFPPLLPLFLFHKGFRVMRAKIIAEVERRWHNQEVHSFKKKSSDFKRAKCTGLHLVHKSY